MALYDMKTTYKRMKYIYNPPYAEHFGLPKEVHVNGWDLIIMGRRYTDDRIAELRKQRDELDTMLELGRSLTFAKKVKG